MYARGAMADDAEPSGGQPDEYERRYMEGDVAALRARQRMPRWVRGLTLAWLVAALVGNGYVLREFWRWRDQPGALGALALLAAVTALGVVLTLLGTLTDHCLRVALTPTHLRAHKGLRTQDIPLAAITAVDVGEARGREGPTLRGALMRREEILMMFGATKRLRVAWRDERGRARTTWVLFDEAPVFARRIEALLAGTSGVRVTVDDAEEAPEPAATVKNATKRR